MDFTHIGTAMIGASLSSFISAPALLRQIRQESRMSRVARQTRLAQPSVSPDAGISSRPTWDEQVPETGIILVPVLGTC
jgi:hypothetical protein